MVQQAEAPRRRVTTGLSGAARSELPLLDSTSKIGGGGFGVLHLDPRAPDRCIKVLNRPLNADQGRSLSRLVEVIRWARPSDVDQLIHQFAWPLEIFGSKSEIVGYTMPLAPQSCMFDLTAGGRTTRMPLSLKFLMDSSYWSGAAVQSAKPHADHQDRLEISIACFDALDVLHSHGLCYGDLSSNNIAAELGDRPSVFLFDADSIAPADVRAGHPLVSPGWEAPDGLEPLGVDRSRFALLVLRLLAEDPNARPDHSSSALENVPGGDRLDRSIRSCYEDGSQAAFVELGDLLRDQRIDSRKESALDRAESSGFARRVQREAKSIAGSDRRKIVSAASAQVRFEHDVDTSDGLAYRTYLRRDRLQYSPFKLDVRPRVELENPPTTSSQLHQLVHESMFAEITSHLAVAGLDKLESDPWLERVVQHAHVELPDVNLDVVVQPGQATLSFTWPGTPYVNCARLRVHSGGGFEDVVCVRDGDDVTSNRLVAAARGLSGQVELAPGTSSPNGNQFFSARPTTVPLMIPRIPEPPRPTPAARRSGQGLSALRPRFEVLDPAVVEAQRIAAVRARRQRWIRRSILAVLTMLALSTGAFYSYRQWFAVADFDAPIFKVSVTDDNYRMTFFWIPQGAERLLVEGTANGKRWVPLAEWPSDGRRVATFFVDSANSPRYFQLRAGLTKDSERVGNWSVWFDAEKTGLTGRPKLSTTSNTRVVWTPAARSDGTTPEYFRYRYSDNDTTDQYDGQTSGSSVDLPQIDVESSFDFKIQSVFSDGTQGPWIVLDPDS